MNDFILPEYWYIEVTDENRDLLNNYRINIINYNSNPLLESSLYMDSDG